MIKFVCNKCGKEIGPDESCMSVNTTYPFGSKYDGCRFVLDLCPECLDDVTEQMSRDFKISPIVNEFGYMEAV